MRKAIYLAPFVALSGKWQKELYRIKIGGNQEGRRYFFGNYRNLTEKSSFGFRTRSAAGLTENQQLINNNFKQAVINADIVLADNAQKAAAIARFKAQSKYKYLRSFVIAEEFAKIN